MFSWIMGHDKLLTNAERWKRKISSSKWCARCDCEEEDTLHAIRDCCWAKEVWLLIIPAPLQHVFFSLDLKEWFLWMLEGGRERARDLRWTAKLLTTCWWQWRWRNAEIFQGARPDRQQKLRQLLGFFEEEEEAAKVSLIQLNNCSLGPRACEY